MRLLHVLLALVGALLLGAWLAPPLGEDPGYVLVRFQGWAFETTAVALALLAIVGYFLFRIALWLLRLPGRAVRGAVEGRREARLERGLIAFAEGRWSRAEKLLSSGARGSTDPAAHYLAAARAAQARGDDNAREDYLALADAQGGDARFATELTRAELMLDDPAQADAAGALLEGLHEERPRNPRVLDLLAASYRNRENWAGLRGLAPALKRAGELDAAGAAALAREAAEAELKTAPDLERLEAAWSSLSRGERHDTALVRAYAERALELGRGNEMAELVQKTIRRSWDENLVLLYGRLPVAEPAAALKRAEGWLKDHPEDGALMLTLGRLCRRAELWGKAREYLERSLAFSPRADTYRELAELKEQQGDTAGAMACYRNVLRLNRGDPVEPVPVADHRRLDAPENVSKEKG